MLDLDHFKRLNDTPRPPAGRRGTASLRAGDHGDAAASDAAYRFGGEELAIIARETTLAERLRAAIESRYPGAGGALRVTASFGVAAMPDHAASPCGLIAAAGAALFGAKTAGRNRVLPQGAAELVDPVELAALVEPLEQALADPVPARG